jgi:hypothetical protein
MVLTAWVGWRWLLFKQVKIKAFCSYAKETVTEPMVGCGRCHEQKIFAVKEP